MPQWLPKPAYTVPPSSKSPVRWSWCVGSKVTSVWLSAEPWIGTGKPGRSASVGRSRAWKKRAAGPEVPDA